MSTDVIIGKCLGISMSHFLYQTYKNKDVREYYAPDGIENIASNICHYCSIDVLEKIIENRALRFTDVRYLNDTTEFTGIIDTIKEVVERGNYSELFKGFILSEEIIGEIKDYKQIGFGKDISSGKYEKKLYRTYTCSFSLNKDSLNMWNYYAKNENGVNISFSWIGDMFEFEDISKVHTNSIHTMNNGIDLACGKILYDQKDKHLCVKALIDMVEDVFNDAENEIDDYKDIIKDAYKSAVNNMRCFFKNNHYKDEDEYRIVLRISEDIIKNNDISKVDNYINGKGFFKRNNVMIPYVDIVFKTESISGICINPYMKKNDTFKQSVKDILWVNDCDIEDLELSSIPVRKYD